MREWYAAPNLVGLPGMPGTDRGVRKRATSESWKSRKRPKGKGREYHITSVPAETQAALILRFDQSTDSGPIPAAAGRGSDTGRCASPAAGTTSAPPPAVFEYCRESLWARLEEKGSGAAEKARKRLEAINAALRMIHSGVKHREAWIAAAKSAGMSRSRLQAWYSKVQPYDRSDWLPVLLDKRGGNRPRKEIPPAAWEQLTSDYLRPAAPSMQACIDRLRQVAETEGWELPSDKTLQSRLGDIPNAIRVLAREGLEAHQRMYPPQRRSREGLHALEVVNADGHKFDVMVRWPDGHVGRPIIVAWQDVYSGRLLPYRIGKSENSDLVRGSWGDLVTQFGIPRQMILDNGKAFAAKFLTGGTATRYTFRVRANDPIGIFTQMNVDIHWAEIKHGQSKPIERFFGDLAEHVSKHPVCEGAYVGNSPHAKPENYGTRAVPFEEFKALVDAQIKWLNAKPGRRGGVCRGRSFDEIFNESYSTAPIQKATEGQRRLWLLAAERVRARKPTGEIHLGGNRYWSEALSDVIGQELVIRFDPDELHAGIIAETLDGRVICRAECIDDSGFIDQAAAAEQRRLTNAWKRSHKAALKKLRQLEGADLAKRMPLDSGPESPDPDAKVVRGMFRQAQECNAAIDREYDEKFSRGVRAAAAARKDEF